MTGRARVLVYEHLSGGGAGPGLDPGLLTEGLQMRDAMVADLLACPGVEVGCAAVEGIGVPDGALARRPRRGESPWDFLRREAESHDRVWAVLPETGGLLETGARALPPARWMGCRAEAIHVATSKRATLAHLQARGLPTPLDFPHGDPLSGHAWVVKPDDGTGAVQTLRHASLAGARTDLAARLAGGQDPTLEAWVAGEPLSLSLLCRGDRAELLAVNRQQLSIDELGRVSLLSVQAGALPADPVLARLASDVNRALPGLRGFVGIDLVRHPARGPVLIEINPRVTSAYPGVAALRARAPGGRRLARDVLDLFGLHAAPGAAHG